MAAIQDANSQRECNMLMVTATTQNGTVSIDESGFACYMGSLGRKSGWLVEACKIRMGETIRLRFAGDEHAMSTSAVKHVRTSFEVPKQGESGRPRVDWLEVATSGTF